MSKHDQMRSLTKSKHRIYRFKRGFRGNGVSPIFGKYCPYKRKTIIHRGTIGNRCSFCKADMSKISFEDIKSLAWLYREAGFG